MLGQGKKEGGNRQRRKRVSRRILGHNNSTAGGVWARQIYSPNISCTDSLKEKQKEAIQASKKHVTCAFLSKKNSTRNEPKQQVKKTVTTQNELSPPKQIIILSVERKKNQNV